MSRRAVVALVGVAWGCGLSVVGSASSDSLTDGGGASDSSSSSSSSSGETGSDLDANGGVDATIDVSVDGDALATRPALKALDFHASSSRYVDCPTIPIPANFTVEAWIKPASTGSEMMIVAEDRTLNTDDQFRLALLNTGHLYFVMTDQVSDYHGLADFSAPVGSEFLLRSPSPIPTGVWSHVAATKNGASFSLLVNGVVVKTFTTGSATFTRVANFSFRVAARMGNGGPANYFDGTIDEVRLYKVARTPAEIVSDMSTSLIAASPGFANLTAYWRFDEGTGGTAQDDVGGFNGTLVNGPAWVSSSAF